MQLKSFQLFCYQGNAYTITGFKIIFSSIFINYFNFSQGYADRIMPTVANCLSVFFVYTFGCISQAVTLAAILLKTEEWSKKSGLLLICSLAFNDLLKCVLQMVGSMESLVAALTGVNDFPPLALVNHASGFLGNANWLTLTAHLVLMAANRFVALYLPFRFSLIFSPSNTKKMLLVCWLSGVVYTALHEFICCPLLWLVPVSNFVYDAGAKQRSRTSFRYQDLDFRPVPQILGVRFPTPPQPSESTYTYNCTYNLQA